MLAMDISRYPELYERGPEGTTINGTMATGAGASAIAIITHGAGSASCETRVVTHAACDSAETSTVVSTLRK